MQAKATRGYLRRGRWRTFKENFAWLIRYPVTSLHSDLRTETRYVTDPRLDGIDHRMASLEDAVRPIPDVVRQLGQAKLASGFWVDGHSQPHARRDQLIDDLTRRLTTLEDKVRAWRSAANETLDLPPRMDRLEDEAQMLRMLVDGLRLQNEMLVARLDGAIAEARAAGSAAAEERLQRAEDEGDLASLALHRSGRLSERFAEKLEEDFN